MFNSELKERVNDLKDSVRILQESSLEKGKRQATTESKVEVLEKKISLILNHLKLKFEEKFERQNLSHPYLGFYYDETSLKLVKKCDKCGK